MKRDLIIVLLTVSFMTPSLAQSGDVARGQQDFRACVACHSLEPDRNMTGPSLARLWGRKAGGLSSFERYSDALKSSGVVWNDDTLDRWIADPQRMVPDNDMPFEGIKESGTRSDLLAFLKEATKAGATPKQSAQMQMNGMGDMMGGGHAPNLKKIEPVQQVEAVTYCADTYRVTTADGKTRAFWEHNLRFKTDSSKDGPEAGAPAILPAGMMGDRASVIFASPDEISRTIRPQC